MREFLPTSSDVSTERSDNPRVVSLDEDRSEDLLAAVQSETARAIVRTLLKNPRTQSEIAETLDMSIENVSYHLENLQEAELISTLDTIYSEKGREMAVYGLSSDPTLLFFGPSEDEQELRVIFAELVPAIGPVAILIVLKRSFTEMFDLGDLGDLGDLF